MHGGTRMLTALFRWGWVMVPFWIVGCGSVQLEAAHGNAGFGGAAQQHTMPPACIALLTSSPNGDRLVQAISLDKSDKGCLDSSAYPAAQARKEGEWLVSFDPATRTTIRYRVVHASTCIYLVEVHQNFGGSFTSGELLVLETGRTAVLGVASKAVLTLIERFEVSQTEQALRFARAAGNARTCASR